MPSAELGKRAIAPGKEPHPYGNLQDEEPGLERFAGLKQRHHGGLFKTRTERLHHASCGIVCPLSKVDISRQERER